MPELPEIVCRAREMNERLVGRSIQAIDVLQPKCLNVPPEAFRGALEGATMHGVTHRGKWLVVDTSGGYLLLNLGMGGEILLVPPAKPPAAWRVRFDLDRRQSLTVNFWWFGHAHYAAPGKLGEHAMLARLGPNALDVSLAELRAQLAARRGGIKAFLLDQANLAGIGNAYIHDILFRARLHPLRPIPSLTAHEVAALHDAIHTELERSIALGAAAYEVGLDGKPGAFGAADLLVGYREGQPCPQCGGAIEKTKTGSTASFLCPRCQPLSRPARSRPPGKASRRASLG